MNRIAKAAALSLFALLALVAPAAAQTDVSGKWTIDVVGPQGPAQITAVLAQDGSEVTGALEIDVVEGVEMSDGMIDGDKLTFLLHVSFDAQWFTIEVEAQVDGDAMSGSLFMAEMGTMPFTGKRAEG